TSRSGDTLDMSRAFVAQVNSVSSTGALSLTNVGDIIDLGLNNTNSAVTVNYSANLSSNEDSMNLSVTDANSTITINSAGSGSLEILTLDSITSRDSEDLINDINLTGSALSGVSDLVLTGSGNLNLSTNGMSNLETVDALVNNGGVTVDLTGATANLSVTGGSGDDNFTAGNGSDTINSGAGDDKVTFTSTTLDDLDAVDGSEGEDVFTLVLGSSGVPALSNNNIINFEILNIILLPDSSNSLDLSNMSMGSLNISGTGNLNLLNAPSIVSEVDASTATGDIQLDLSNIVNDLSVKGGSGDDKIISGSGIDDISGAAGADTFTFGADTSGLALGEIDIVTDFAAGTDLLDFDGLPGKNGNFVDVGGDESVDYTSALDAINAAMALLIAQGLPVPSYVFTDNTTDGWVFVNNDADGDVDLSIQLTGVTTNVAADITGVIFL
ncbi:MAG: hypothetical protein Q8L68_04800, partial [Methylococcales bacterium]|nr:hypothetical protein [Methylococcales bacterium]